MRSPKRVRLVFPPQSVTVPNECLRRASQQVTIEKLSDEVLLNIFRYYLDASPRFWLWLVHICCKWRRIVFASQRALRLRLFCTHGTPVLSLKALDYWLALPIVVHYGGSLALDPPAPGDEDNIMAALNQSDRVDSINLTVTSSLLKKLFAIKKPFSQLEDLVLLSRDGVQQTLPRAFRWGTRLRCLHSTRIVFPALLHLLYYSRNLVDLQLHEAICSLHFLPEALTDALSGMTQLQSFSLHLLTTAKYITLGFAPPPPPEERITLPVLTRLDFRGIAEYLEGLVARIDAPRLGDIEVTLLNKFVFDSSKLSEFIDRIEIQKSPLQADIVSSDRAVSISITRPEASMRLELQVSCKPLTRQSSYMAQICHGLSTFLLGVEQLRISTTRPPRKRDKSDQDEWAELILPFRGAKWVHVAGDHSTNIIRALQLSHKLLPALHKLCIAQPGPRHGPLRDAVVSFMTSRRLSGHSMAVEYEQLCRHITEPRGTGPFSQQALTEKLSDDVLLNIFQQYLDASPRRWPELAHVCRSWRQIIFASPLGLHLRLYCTYGTPVLKNLGFWPSFPLVVDYVGSPMLRPPAPEDEDNIVGALEKSDRVCSISLTVSSSLLKKLSAISEPISELEQLVLLSQDNVHSTLPRASAFWWGYRLRTLHSTRIAIPSLPQLLLPSQDLVDLQLHEIPGDGYFPPEAFAYALCGMSQLETLSLHFLSLPPRRNYPGFPPPPGDRIALPALSRFKYRGISKYLDSLVARIDAPRLEDIDITFFNQPTLDASQLGLFVDRIETWSSSFQVDILSSAGAISITITQPGALKRLVLQISCEQLDWQLSSITQIFDHFSTFLSSVEDLGIEVIRPSSVPDNVDDQQWRGLIRAFDGVKDFRVTGKLTIDIIRALNPADEGEKVVLPALRYIYAQERTAVDPPLASQDSVKLFLAQRQLSNRPVGIYYGSPQQRQQQLRQQQLKQRVMQAQQDSLYARQLNILVAQGQQQQNGFASRVGQNLHPPEMGLPQGQGSLQQNFIQPSPSVPPANLQSSVAPSASQPTPPGGTQIHSLPKNFIDMPVPQLSIVYGQLMRTVEEGEKNLNAAGPSAGGEGEMQRQAFRARLDSQKQLLVNIRELINLKRQGGDPAQQAVNGAWLGAGQRATGLYSVPERPPQHNSPLNQASVNQLPPQGRIPTPQQNFGPSVTAQSNLTQMSPHVTVNGPFTPMPGAPPQLTTQCSKLPPLPEDRFKALFTQFANTTGLRLNDRDFIIDGRSVSPWALHRAVFARNGFDSVTTSDEWPAVGATLGFPPFPAGSPTQPRRCALTIAHRLLKLYNDYLRHFEQTCIDNAISQQRAS